MADLNLVKGDSFVLHFDFGDMYRFHFLVKDVIPRIESADVRLISVTGDPVIQYPGTSFDLLADE